MKPILVAYATREGHTREIAERIARALRERGLEGTLLDAEEAQKTGEPLGLERYAAAILASSVHAGRYDRSMEKLISRERDALERIPTAFISVSLTEAGVENTELPEERRAEAARQLGEITEAFFEKTGWHPGRTQQVAGALMYSRYNLLVRWVMKRIAAREGGSTDTSRDHVYTDWDALDLFAHEFLEGVTG